MIVVKTMEREKPSVNNEKAIFFLRHNNDIDHITPVLYKWLSTRDINTEIIITSKKEFLDDYRIKYLKDIKNIKINHINDFFSKYSIPYFFNIIYYKYTTELDKFLQKEGILKNITNKIINKIASKLLEDADKGIVVFDWTRTYFVQQVVKNAKNKGLITLSLPHGDEPYFNEIQLINSLDFNGMNIYKNSEIFDYVVVPNKLCYRRYEPFLEKERIKILGSPRYSDEWMKIVNEYVLTYKAENCKDKLKIVLFLKNTSVSIFWEEVVRTIKMITQFPNICLAVKHHPRNRLKKELTRKLIRLYPEIKQDIGKNLIFIYESVDSASLFKWADIVLDLGTSATWEAIKQKKPVLMLEYLYSNYSTVAHYIKNTEIRCRDDLYNYLQEFSENKIDNFYNEVEREKFIKEIIDVPDKNILERYCKFMETCLAESIEVKK